MAIKVVMNIVCAKIRGHRRIRATLREQGTNVLCVTADLDYCLQALKDENRAYELVNGVEVAEQLATILKTKGIS